MHDNSTNRIASVYLAFAERQAHGRSALCETLARGVASDSVALSFLGQLPRAKQQPNLLFAAVKYLYGTPVDQQRTARSFSRRDARPQQTVSARPVSALDQPTADGLDRSARRQSRLDS